MRPGNAALWTPLVLGESAKQVPAHIRPENSAIEWLKNAGFHDVLAHDYCGLDEDIIWDVIDNKIPPLREAFEQELHSVAMASFRDAAPITGSSPGFATSTQACRRDERPRKVTPATVKRDLVAISHVKNEIASR
jgi:hypothetical protein